MLTRDISVTASRLFCRSEGEFVMVRGNTKQEILDAIMKEVLPAYFRVDQPMRPGTGSGVGGHGAGGKAHPAVFQALSAVRKVTR